MYDIISTLNKYTKLIENHIGVCWKISNIILKIT